MLATSWISPLASRVGLPISRVISAARSAIRSSYRSATRNKDLGPLVFRGGPPGPKGAGRTLQHLLDLRVGRGGELPLGLVGGRVDDLELAHADCLRLSLTRLLPVPGPALVLLLVQLLTIIPGPPAGQAGQGWPSCFGGSQGLIRLWPGKQGCASCR